jgi:hypothetical protein
MRHPNANLPETEGKNKINLVRFRQAKKEKKKNAVGKAT